jgi:phage antirepressor YoqD-like protein
MERTSKEKTYTLKQAIPMIGFPQGRTTLFRWLRDKKILQKDNVPYRRYIDLGHFNYKMIVVNKSTGKRVVQPRITIKGTLYLSKLVRKEFPLCPPCGDEVIDKQ